MRPERKRWAWTLLLAGILGAPAPAAQTAGIDWSKARLATVVMVEYRFVPDHLVFNHGVAYRLHVENHGRELHELTAPDLFKAVEVRNPEVLNRERMEIVLPPGKQKDLYFLAPGPGRYGMRCADHDWAGMTGDITIE